MHTVKSKESISSAYFNYGVKSFSLDNKDELRKILEATNQAKDLKLFVRIAISNEHAEICLLYTSPSPRDQRGSRMPSSA